MRLYYKTKEQRRKNRKHGFWKAYKKRYRASLANYKPDTEYPNRERIGQILRARAKARKITI